MIVLLWYVSMTGKQVEFFKVYTHFNTIILLSTKFKESKVLLYFITLIKLFTHHGNICRHWTDSCPTENAEKIVLELFEWWAEEGSTFRFGMHNVQLNPRAAAVLPTCNISQAGGKGLFTLYCKVCVCVCMRARVCVCVRMHACVCVTAVSK